MDVIHKSKYLLLQIANVMDISRFCCVSYHRISKKNKLQVKHYKSLSCFYCTSKAILCLLLKYLSSKYDQRFQDGWLFRHKSLPWDRKNLDIPILASARREYPTFYFPLFSHFWKQQRRYRFLLRKILRSIYLTLDTEMHRTYHAPNETAPKWNDQYDDKGYKYCEWGLIWYTLVLNMLLLFVFLRGSRYTAITRVFVK